MAIERNLNVNVTAKDKASKVIKKVSRSMDPLMTRAIDSTNKAMAAQQKAFQSVTQSAEKNTRAINQVAEEQNRLSSTFEKIRKVAATTADIMTTAGKAITFLGQTMVFLVGKDRAFDMINIAASRLANVVERVIEVLKRMGGPFAKLVPVMKIIQVLLRSNIAGFLGFAAAGAEQIESASNLRQSILGLGGGYIKFHQKVQIASIALSRYADILLHTDGISNKFKGTILKGFSNIGLGASSLMGHVSELSSEFLMLGAAIAGMAFIDALFIPIDAAMGKLIGTIVDLNFKLMNLDMTFKANFKAQSKFMKGLESLSKSISSVFKNIGASVKSFKLTLASSGNSVDDFAKTFMNNFRSIKNATKASVVSLANLDRSVGAAQVRLGTIVKMRVHGFFLDVANGAKLAANSVKKFGMSSITHMKPLIETVGILSSRFLQAGKTIAIFAGDSLKWTGISVALLANEIINLSGALTSLTLSAYVTTVGQLAGVITSTVGSLFYGLRDGFNATAQIIDGLEDSFKEVNRTFLSFNTSAFSKQYVRAFTRINITAAKFLKTQSEILRIIPVWVDHLRMGHSVSNIWNGTLVAVNTNMIKWSKTSKSLINNTDMLLKSLKNLPSSLVSIGKNFDVIGAKAFKAGAVSMRSLANEVVNLGIALGGTIFNTFGLAFAQSSAMLDVLIGSNVINIRTGFKLAAKELDIFALRFQIMNGKLSAVNTSAFSKQYIKAFSFMSKSAKEFLTTQSDLLRIGADFIEGLERGIRPSKLWSSTINQINANMIKLTDSSRSIINTMDSFFASMKKISRSITTTNFSMTEFLLHINKAQAGLKNFVTLNVTKVFNNMSASVNRFIKSFDLTRIMVNMKNLFGRSQEVAQGVFTLRRSFSEISKVDIIPFFKNMTNGLKFLGKEVLGVAALISGTLANAFVGLAADKIVVRIAALKSILGGKAEVFTFYAEALKKIHHVQNQVQMSLFNLSSTGKKLIPVYKSLGKSVGQLIKAKIELVELTAMFFHILGNKGISTTTAFIAVVKEVTKNSKKYTQVTRLAVMATAQLATGLQKLSKIALDLFTKMSNLFNSFRKTSQAIELGAVKATKASFSFSSLKDSLSEASNKAKKAAASFASLVNIKLAQFISFINKQFTAFVATAKEVVRNAQDVAAGMFGLGKSAGAARVNLSTLMKIRVQDFFARIAVSANTARSAFAKFASDRSDTIFVKIMNSVAETGDRLRKFSSTAVMGLKNFAKELRMSSGDVNSFAEFVKNKGGKALLRFARFSAEQALSSLKLLRSSLGNLRLTLKVFAEQTKLATTMTMAAGKAFITGAKHTEIFEKGLAGTVTRAGLLSSGMGALGIALSRSEDTMDRVAGVTLIALSAAMGGLTFLVQQAILAIGDLISAMGDSLTKASEKQIELFGKAEKSAFAFQKLITGAAHSAEEAAESFKNWSKFIKQTADATGTGGDNLRLMTAETIAATESMDLSQAQMEKLIETSIDLGETFKVDVVDSLMSMIGGLNGNGQAVQKLGLHINDSAVAHSKLSEEVKKNFKSMGDAEKAQVRLNVMVEQAAKVAGFATQNTNLYSKSLKIQETASKDLYSEMGKGAELINGQVVFGLANLTKAFTDTAKPILPLIGFLQALGGRFLQVTGFMVQHFLSIGLLMTSYKAFNALLAKGVIEGVFVKSIPLINKSITDIAKKLGATKPNFNSLGQTAKTAMTIVRVQTAKAVREMFRLDAVSKITARTLLTQLAKGFIHVAKAIGRATLAAMQFALTPVGASIIAVTVTMFLLVKALQKIEERTSILSRLWERISKVFEAANPLIEKMAKAFEKISIILIDVLGMAITGTAALISGLMSKMFATIKQAMIMSRAFSKYLPEGLVASEESLQSVIKAEKEMLDLSKELAVETAQQLVDALTGSAQAADKDANSKHNLAVKIKVLTKQYEKLNKSSSEAFDGIDDLAPSIAMDKTRESTMMLISQLSVLKKTGKDLSDALKIKFSGPARPALVEKQLFEIEQRTKQLNIAIAAHELKIARSNREAKISEVEIELQNKYDKHVTVQNEINKLRIDSAHELQDKLIEIESRNILARRNLEGKRAGTKGQRALIKANEREIQFHKDTLDIKKKLSLNVAREIKNADIQAARESRDSQIEILTNQILEEKRIRGKNAATIDEQVRINVAQEEMRQFTEKLEAQKQLAIDVELEKQIKLAEIRANALQGTPEGARAAQDVEVLAATRKNAQLAQLRSQGINVEKEQMIVARQQKNQQLVADAEMEMAAHQRKADALGLSESGFQSRLSKNDERHMLEMEQLRLQRETEELTDTEFIARKEELEQAHLIRQAEIKEKFINEEIQRNEKLGNQWQATLKRMELSQAKHGQIMGTIKGIQASQEFQQVNTAMSNLASLRNSKNKKMFEVGKRAAMAQTVVQTFLAATSAMASLSPIPIVGPALGIAAAAAAVAAGLTNLQNIKSQKFNGGQADEGLDFVPKSMGGKSFILSGGERVLQPEANKDITAFLKDQKGGGMGGNEIHIHIASVDSPERIEEIKQAVMDGIREASERGEPIISEKGVVAS